MNSLDAFTNVRKAGDGWTARCPAHDDRRNSLSIGEGEGGRTLLKCHAGCALDDILAAAHLEHTDLFPEHTKKTDSRIVATYDYRDAGGLLLYQQVRLQPKDFRSRRPAGGNGKWIWNLGNEHRVLYRLPDVQGKTTIYVTEGEKDVDRLYSVGIPATTNAGGAGKWRGKYVQQLKAASVEQTVVLPDNDEPGQKHAEDIARSCHAAGLRVKVVSLPNLPPKGDVSDWLEAHTKDELIQFVKATELYSPTVATAEPPTSGRVVTLTPASTITPRPVRWGWQDRLALGTFNLLGGREGIGKSIVECTLAADMTRGRLPGVYFGVPKAVIIVATEDARNYTIVPRLMAADADLDKVFFVDVQAPDGFDTALSLPRDLPALEQLIVAQDVAAVWFDPILSRLDAALDSHKDGEVRQALEPLSAMAERTNCMFTGLIHVNKSASNDPLTTLMASRAFAAVARAVLFVMVDPQDEKTRLLGQPKNNLGRSDLRTLAFQIAGAHVADTPDGAVWTGKLHWTGETERSIRDALQEAAEAGGVIGP
jgi:5S rRNA maturation endonuclease (ribonuclease M5)